MKNKVYFMAVLLLLMAIAVVRQEEFLRFAVSFLLLFGAVLFGMVHIQAKWIKAEIRFPEAFGNRNGNLRVEAVLTNQSYLPAAEILVRLAVIDLYSGKKEVLYGKTMADSGGKTVLCFELSAVHCGVLSFVFEKVSVSDVLGIFQARCRYPQKASEFPILPEQRDGKFPEKSGKSAGLKDEEKEPDAYEIRPFRQGDTMHQIHWKVSARTEEILVREFPEEKKKGVLLWLDLQSDTVTRDRQEWDCFLEKTASLCRHLLEQKIEQEVCWYDVDAAETVRFYVQNEEKLIWMLSRLLYAKQYLSDGGQNCFKENNADGQYGTILRPDGRDDFRWEKGEEN